MPAASDYVTGTISLTNGSANFTGTSTGWLLAGFKEGDTIIDITGATEYMGVIATIDANGSGTLTKAWEGPTLSDVAYRMRYQPDGARVSAQARNLIELMGNGNLQAMAGLSGSANQVPMFTGPGAMTLVPKTDLVSGANYDVQVDDLAARAAYDAQAEGYAVFVADVGDGRAAIYSKVSATSGDWSDPAYVTGPAGPLPDVTIGTVTTGDPGSAAQVTATPTIDGVELDFSIPAGEGFAFQGAYSGATTYVLGDVAQESGSSWILTVAESTGNAPPTLPTTSNAYWQLLARQGIDGAGTVNAVDPGTAISVDNADPTAPIVNAVLASQVEAETGTENAKLMTPLRTAQAIAALGANLPPRYWQGYQHTNSVGSPNTQIDIAAGSARDSTDAIDIINSSGILNLATSGANGLDAGSLANSTWYYTFAIAKDDGSSAFLASTSPTAPTLPATYTKFRRIGSFKTNGSAQVLPFIHVNDTWYWATTIRDKSAAADVGTTLTALALSVPRVYGVTALISVTGWNAGGAVAINVVPGFLTDTARNGFTYYFDTAAGGTIPGRVMVNASAQVGYRASLASTNLVIDTAGWVDPL